MNPFQPVCCTNTFYCKKWSPMLTATIWYWIIGMYCTKSKGKEYLIRIWLHYSRDCMLVCVCVGACMQAPAKSSYMLPNTFHNPSFPAACQHPQTSNERDACHVSSSPSQMSSYHSGFSSCSHFFPKTHLCPPCISFFLTVAPSLSTSAFVCVTPFLHISPHPNILHVACAWRQLGRDIVLSYSIVLLWSMLLSLCWVWESDVAPCKLAGNLAWWLIITVCSIYTTIV